MSARDVGPRIRCPSCSFSLTEKEQVARVCDNCGRVLDEEYLRISREDLGRKELREKRVILLQHAVGGLGMIMIVLGVAAVIANRSNWSWMTRRGLGFIVLTGVVIAWRWREREPMWPVLLLLGIFWLVMALLWGF